MLLAACCAPCRLVAARRPWHLAMQSTCACSEGLQGAQALSEPSQSGTRCLRSIHTRIAAIRMRTHFEPLSRRSVQLSPRVAAIVTSCGVRKHVGMGQA